MRKSNDLSTSDFDDSGVVTTSNLGRVDMASINITDGSGQEYFVEGFDYVSHLLGDNVVCSCGDGIDPHQIAMYTPKREWVIIPARCCSMFRWFRSGIE